MAENQDNLVENGAAAGILPDAAAAAALATLSDVDEEPPLANSFLEPVVLRPGRFTFAKKKLLALSGLFLLDPLVPMPQVVDYLVGTITHCPSKTKNGSCFIVDWVVNSPGMPATIDKTLFRTRYKSTPEMREELRAGCLLYMERVMDVPFVLGHSFGIVESDIVPPNATAILPPAILPPVAEVPAADALMGTPLRNSRRASFMTHDCSISTITASQQAEQAAQGPASLPASQRSTRSGTTDGSDIDSDDDMTCDEEDDLDEEDDFWAIPDEIVLDDNG